MKFLFFDIECACCFKHGNGVICEFGYVLTDERLNVLKKEVLLVAPEAEFQWYVIKNVLAFTKEEYNSSPNFKERYDKIRSLLEDKDTTVIGHTTDVDARYLNFAATRYEVPFINFEFYDIKKIYRHKKKAAHDASLENMVKELNLDFVGHLHTSDDAYATMLVFKELCKNSDGGALSLIAEYSEFKGNTAEGIVKKAKLPPIVLTEEEMAERRRKMLENCSVENVVNKNNFFVLNQLNNGDVSGEIIESPLKDKNVLIDRDYQEKHFKEMLSLISLIKQHGGRCSFYPKGCDVYVDVAIDESERKYSYYVNIARKKEAEIITFERLLSILNATEEDLRQMPLPPYSAFKKKKKVE